MSICITFPNINVLAEIRADSAVKFYVAPHGDDSAAGTIDSPLATMEGARNKVREYKNAYGYPDGGITVYFRGGKYQVTQKTDFEEQDSGTDEYPVIYRAYENEKPVFTGGSYIKGSDFKKVTDESVLSRFVSEDAKKNVLCYDLKANGITDYGIIPDSWGTQKNGLHNQFGMKMPAMGVYVDDEAFRMARYPNLNDDCDKGWLFVSSVINSGPAWEWYTGRTPEFTYTDTELEKWSSYDDIHLAGILNWQYFYDDVKVREIDKKLKKITLNDSTYSGAAKNGKYYLYNILDELDDPGEYYIDRTNGILYLYPTENFNNAEIGLATYAEQLMVECKDLSYCIFEGLIFELTRGSVARVVGGDSVRFSRDTFRNIGIRAIWLGDNHVADGAVDRAPDLEGELAKCYDNAANGVNHSVTSCKMYNLGYGGIKMTGGDIYHIQSANFSVENCEIHDFGQYQWGYDQGINYYGRGFRIRNNKLYNAPMGGMQGQAMDVLIEYNELYNVARYTTDAGAIYTNYTWPTHDLYIRYNYIHDIPETNLPKEHYSWDSGVAHRCAIYTDTELFSPHIYGNVIANCPIGYYHSGITERVENNVFIDCHKAVGPFIDKAGMKGWTGKEISETGGDSPFRFVIYFPWESEEWQKAYPEMTKEYEEFKAMEDTSQRMCYIKRNLLVYNKHPEWYEMNQPDRMFMYTDADAFVYEDNIITTENPGFEDMSNGNYRLKDDASVYSTLPGFEKIDINKMGLLTENAGVDLDKDPVTPEVQVTTVQSSDEEGQEVTSCSTCPYKN